MQTLARAGLWLFLLTHTHLQKRPVFPVSFPISQYNQWDNKINIFFADKSLIFNIRHLLVPNIRFKCPLAQHGFSP